MADEKAALEQARRDYLARAQERAAQGLLGVVDESPLPALAEEAEVSGEVELVDDHSGPLGEGNEP